MLQLHISTSVLIKVLVSVRAFSGIVALTGGIELVLLDIVSFRLSLSSQAFALAVSVGTVGLLMSNP